MSLTDIIIRALIYTPICIVGGLCILGVFSALIQRKKRPVNTLYLKRYPDGTKAFRLGLRINLDALEPGDKFEVIVQEEKPTDTDIFIYNNVKED